MHQEAWKHDNEYPDYCKDGCTECDLISYLDSQDLEAEYFNTLTNGITLDRLQEICNAERDGRLVILKPPLTTDDLETIKNIGRIVNNLNDMKAVRNESRR